jgi:hypothetical protein
MHTIKRNIGKFQGNDSYMLASAVYNATMDGTCAQLGDVEGFGFYAFVEGKRYGFLMHESNQGFISVNYYSLKEARERWAKIEAEYEKWIEEYGETD